MTTGSAPGPGSGSPPPSPPPRKLSGAALGKFYTPGLQDELIAHVRRGCIRSEAAKRCKIAPRSFGYWMARGKANLAEVAEAEEREPGSGDALLNDFGIFRLEVEAAEAHYERSLIAVIEKKAASSDKDAWKASAWLAERRFRPRWGRSGAGGGQRELDSDDDGGELAGEPASIAQGMTDDLRASIEDQLLGVPRRRRES